MEGGASALPEGVPALQPAPTATSRGRGRPMKESEPVHYEVLVDSVDAALTGKAKAREVLRPLCSIFVPYGLLARLHEDETPNYITGMNAHIPGHILHLDTACICLERGLAPKVGKVTSALSQAKGSRAKNRIPESGTHFVVCEGEALDTELYMSERNGIEVY